MIADDLGQFIKADSGATASLTDMVLKDLIEHVTPPLATNPLHQPFHRMTLCHQHPVPSILCDVSD
jgi:hypothetical protein